MTPRCKSVGCPDIPCFWIYVLSKGFDRCQIRQINHIAIHFAANQASADMESEAFVDHWHIEVSSICTLRCPRCTRTESAETLLNRQLTLDFFKTQIGEQRIKEMRKISFCGDDGDPIYAKQFLEIVAWIKDINPSIQLYCCHKMAVNSFVYTNMCLHT